MDPGVTAALAVGGASYGSYIFGWSSTVSKLFAIATVAALCGLNMLNTRAGAGFLRYATWLKLGILALLVIWALVFRLGSVVALCTVRRPAHRLCPAAAGHRGRFGRCLLQLRGMVGRQQDCRRDQESGTHSAASTGAGRARGDRRLRPGKRGLHLPYSSGERHLRSHLCRAGGSHPVWEGGRQPPGRRGHHLRGRKRGSDDHALSARVLRHGA